MKFQDLFYALHPVFSKIIIMKEIKNDLCMIEILQSIELVFILAEIYISP
jgi:hypothetical protein